MIHRLPSPSKLLVDSFSREAVTSDNAPPPTMINCMITAAAASRWVLPDDVGAHHRRYTPAFLSPDVLRNQSLAAMPSSSAKGPGKISGHHDQENPPSSIGYEQQPNALPLFFFYCY
uniref:Uncharacterized protein n=1 Tax=Arundo donax TaxID=35708 RepID=A0A0A9HHT1_ARUDO